MRENRSAAESVGNMQEREREDGEDGKLRGLSQIDAPQRVGTGTRRGRPDVDLVTAAQEGVAPPSVGVHGHTHLTRFKGHVQVNSAECEEERR